MTDHVDVPIVATGDWIDAAWINQYIGDNVRAWRQGFVTGGDMPYALDANTIAALNKPSVDSLMKMGSTGVPAWLATGLQHTFLRSNGTSPEFGPLVYRRQGGSSTVWSSPGTSNYTPTKTLVQLGAVNVSVSSGAGSQAVTYDTAFAERPAIFLSVNANSAAIAYSWGLGWTDDTLSGFTAHIKFSGAFSGTAPISWLAIGG